MFSQSGKKILLCCILAGITGCSDVVVSISGTNNESVCVDNTVYTLHSTDDGSTLSNRYCSTCNNGLCQVCTPGENTCYNVNRNNMKFSYRDECDDNGQYQKLACNDIPECKDDKGDFLEDCDRKPECVNPEFHCDNNACYNSGGG